MAFPVSDELLGTFLPIAVYWVYSGIYVILGNLNEYRLHSKVEEDTKNAVSKGTVVKGVLVQQAFQIVVSLLLFTVCVFFIIKLREIYIHTTQNHAIFIFNILNSFITRIPPKITYIYHLVISVAFGRRRRRRPGRRSANLLCPVHRMREVTERRSGKEERRASSSPLSSPSAKSDGNDKMVMSDDSGVVLPQPSLFVMSLQFIVAMVVMDTWQYFMHRFMHINKFLYKHIHSKHHTLIVPYSFGALYNHPLEGLLLDTIGGALSFLISGMTPRTSIFFFSFATIKTVNDHCGLWLPGNLLNICFNNNSAYHDIHHQLYGTKYNFSQPFFVTWDKILGTHMPYSLEKRKEGGFEARLVKKIN